jgi:alkylation response protein AidB-like acyl-CoA dehydrogenase
MLFVVCVDTDRGPGIAILERAAGLEIEKLPVADRTRSVARLRCHDVRVPANHVVQRAQALRLAAQLTDEARILIAGDCIGGAEALLEATVEYLKTRRQFSKPIGSFQALKHRCADHKVKLEASRRLVQRAILGCDSDRRTSWAAMAKFSACNCFADIASDSIQLHGGIGFTWQHDAHLFLKRALLNQFMFGDGARLQDEVAARLMAGEV